MKKLLLILLSAMLVLSLAGCNATVPVEPSTSGSIPDTSTPPSSGSGERTITDLGGNTVTLPPAEEIKRVVIITPPATSILLGVIPDTEMIVGVSKQTFAFANPEILGKLFPNWNSVETAFVNDNFETNTEELLNLDPDIVFYYGDFQKSGIENLGIPIVDFMIKGETDPETITIAQDNLMRHIFDVEGSTTLEKEWATSNQKAQEVLSTYTGEKKSALYVMNNTGGIITVYGSGTYADGCFESSGLVNVAADVKGQAEVSMEQLYQWNPDYIYVFMGTPASVMLQNKVQGQDWSLLAAYKNKTILDMPQAISSWGASCSDSPLMTLWLISQSYPDLLSADEFRALFSEYYEKMYGAELGDDVITSVLSPRKLPLQ